MRAGFSQTGAKAIIRPLKKKDGSESVDIYTPEDVLACDDAGELKHLLSFYGRSPFLRDLLPDDVFVRRVFVEQVRPALRWYCAHFGTPVPRWLRGTGVEDFTPEDMKSLFGDKPLEPIEFERRLPVEETQMQDAKSGRPHEKGPVAKPPAPKGPKS